MLFTAELEKKSHVGQALVHNSHFSWRERLSVVDDEALVCTKEKLLDEAMIAPAKTGGVPADSWAEKVYINKVLAYCRDAFASGRRGQPASKWCTLWLVIGLGSMLTMLAWSARVCCSSVVVLRRSACDLLAPVFLCPCTMYDFRSPPSLSLGTKVVTKLHGEEGTGLRCIRFR